MNIKLITKLVVLFCLITIIIIPVWARIINIISSDDLEAFGRFGLSSSGPLGVLIGGLAVSSATRNRNGSKE